MRNTSKKVFSWLPTLYFSQGLPYAVLTTLMVTMCIDLGFDISNIGIYSALLVLPAVLRPFLAPLVDLFGTKTKWIIITQLLITVSILGIVFSIPSNQFKTWIVISFFIFSLISSFCDIAIDGFYILALPSEEQTKLAGIRNMFYRLAVIFVQSGLVYFAGVLKEKFNDSVFAWVYTFLVLVLLFAFFSLYHTLKLPVPSKDNIKKCSSPDCFFSAYKEIFKTFFLKNNIVLILFFLFFYRAVESSLLTCSYWFLFDSKAQGGLALDLKEFGQISAVVGSVSIIIGGLLGGYVISKVSLRKSIIPIVLFNTVIPVLYLWLSYALPDNLWIIGTVLAFEYLAFGLSIVVLLLYIISISGEKNPTAHFAIAIAFVSLGQLCFRAPSGFIYFKYGNSMFFIIVFICGLISLTSALFIRKTIFSSDKTLINNE